MKKSTFKNWETGVFSMPDPNPKSTTTQWYALDNEKSYDKRPHPVYSDTSIEYKWNEHGFRSDEFEEEQDAIMFLGCSHTMGVGLPLEHTWAYLLRNLINPDYKIYNLGMGGQSGDFVARVAHKTIGVLKPKAVFVMWPDDSRREVQTGSEMYSYNIHENNKMYPDVFLDDGYQRYQSSKNKVLVNTVCQLHSIPVYHINYRNIDGREWTDTARDHQHNGLPWNEYIANKVYETYCNSPHVSV